MSGIARAPPTGLPVSLSRRQQRSSGSRSRGSLSRQAYGVRRKQYSMELDGTSGTPRDTRLELSHRLYSASTIERKRSAASRATLPTTARKSPAKKSCARKVQQWQPRESNLLARLLGRRRFSLQASVRAGRQQRLPSRRSF